MTTDEERLAELNDKIDDAQNALRDAVDQAADRREAVRFMWMERSALQQRIREATPEYQRAQADLRSAAQEPRETAPVQRREDT